MLLIAGSAIEQAAEGSVSALVVIVVLVLVFRSRVVCQPGEIIVITDRSGAKRVLSEPGASTYVTPITESKLRMRIDPFPFGFERLDVVGPDGTSRAYRIRGSGQVSLASPAETLRAVQVFDGQPSAAKSEALSGVVSRALHRVVAAHGHDAIPPAELPRLVFETGFGEAASLGLAVLEIHVTAFEHATGADTWS